MKPPILILGIALAGCAGAGQVMQFADAKQQQWKDASGSYSIYDKPQESRLLMQGMPLAKPSHATAGQSAVAWLASTGRAGCSTKTVMLVPPTENNFEISYSCP